MSWPQQIFARVFTVAGKPKGDGRWSTYLVTMEMGDCDVMKKILESQGLQCAVNTHNLPVPQCPGCGDHLLDGMGGHDCPQLRMGGPREGVPHIPRGLGTQVEVDAFAEASIDEAMSRIQHPDACKGCGSRPGDGTTEECDHPEGCGFWRRYANE